jgi:phage-related protein
MLLADGLGHTCLRQLSAVAKFRGALPNPTLLLRVPIPTPCQTYTHLYNGPVSDKILVWMGVSFEDLRDFPPDARRAAGYELRRVQRGSMPTDWKPMTGVGPGVNEIRIHTRAEHRVLYVAKFEEAVYVLHAFEKKSRQTRDTDLSLARERLKQVEALRREGKEK